MSNLTIDLFCDGAMTHEGEMSYGWTAHYHADSEVFQSGSGEINHRIKTVPVAEYFAILNALAELDMNGGNIQGGDHIVIYSDAQLVINQLNEVYKTKAYHLVELKEKVHRKVNLKYLMNDIGVEFIWIPREQNHRADKLSR